MKDFSYRVLRTALTVVSKLPLPFHYFNAHILAFIMEKCVKYRIDVTEDNLRNSFPDKDEKWIRKVRHEYYLHLARIFAEAIWFGGCRPGGERLRKSGLVKMVNPEVPAAAWEKGHGVMIFSAHTGNWELSGGIQKFNYSEIDTHISEDNYCVVYLKQTSPCWNEILHINRLAALDKPREFKGYLESREFIRYALTHAEDKFFYNVIGDQRPYVHSGKPVVINFMHRQCRAMTAGATIACKLGMAVIYQRMMENTKGHGYTLEYVKICDDASKSDPESIIKRYFQLLEEDLHNQPYNYLWTHRRWS